MSSKKFVLNGHPQSEATGNVETAVVIEENLGGTKLANQKVESTIPKSILHPVSRTNSDSSASINVSKPTASPRVRYSIKNKDARVSNGSTRSPTMKHQHESFVKANNELEEQKGVTSRFKIDRVFNDEIDRRFSVAVPIDIETVKSLKAVHDEREIAEEDEEEEGQEGTDYEDEKYDTLHSDCFKNHTNEALPRMENYRNQMSIHKWAARPSLDEIHGVQATVMTNIHNKRVCDSDDPERQKMAESTANLGSQKEKPAQKKQTKFGWIEGVLIRCLLNIWGVMLFLRLSWVGGQAGLWLGAAVVLLSTVVTVLTTISMSAICTNGEVKTGGTYYMISRSLGPEFGGAIGIIFSLANAVAVAMYTIGFAEALRDLLVTLDIVIFDGGLNDVRLISVITVTVLLCIVFIGTEWESKTQMGLLVILLAAMLDFLIGVMMPPNDEKKAKGFVGMSSKLLVENMETDYRDGQGFFSVFAIFFPAATGITAGANISGDLKNPSEAIPKGTMLAVVITTISYILFLILVVAGVSRDANGLVELVVNVTDVDVLLPLIRNCSSFPENRCPHGLLNSFQIMEMMSAFGPIIYAGIFAATLSSALASLVSGPKIFQALCQDGLFPYIGYFGKEFGVNKEPKRGYMLAFLIALMCCLIGELNAIAPIISNFFLAAYLLMNFSCFHASLSKSPGFRPGYRWYNQWFSLAGALLCMSVMFITSWVTALFTIVIVSIFYMYIQVRKPDVNWGSSTQAQIYVSAVNNVYRLSTIPDHVKTYRPSVLLLSGSPATRPLFVSLASDLTRRVGLLICGQVVVGSPLSARATAKLKVEANKWMAENRFKTTFYSVVQEASFYAGVRTMLQAVGIGKLSPNIVMLGIKQNWTECETTELVDYFQTIHMILDRHLALVILALPEVSEETEKHDVNTTNGQAITSMGQSISFSKAAGVNVNSNLIDVWWLYDNGGLTVLLPYILSTRDSWKGCRLRIFTLANKVSELEEEQRNMATLLAKFRIDFHDLIMITDIMKPPKRSTRREFYKLIEPYIWDETEEAPRKRSSRHTEDAWLENFYVTDEKLATFKEKTDRHLRLHEALLQYSKDSRMVVMSLPVPRKGKCPAALYMAWLTMLTRGMPPMMLTRGNHTDVLTFYS